MKKKAVKPGSAEELAELYPSPQTVTVRVRDANDTYHEESVTIAEMDIMQIAQVAKALQSVHGLSTDNLLLLAAQYPDELFAAVGIAIRRPAADVARFAAGSFATVLAKVYEANEGFFIQLLGLLAIAPRATASANGDGGLPLRTSASTDTSITQNVSH